jgi:hypothetical protein
MTAAHHTAFAHLIPQDEPVSLRQLCVRYVQTRETSSALHDAWRMPGITAKREEELDALTSRLHNDEWELRKAIVAEFERLGIDAGLRGKIGIIL